jgi:hypothetical protein
MIHSIVLIASSSDFANAVTMIHENRIITESSMQKMSFTTSTTTTTVKHN